jgi:HTH-type transcriptional regulator / antitoxin HigA
MSNTPFTPAEVFPPGEFIREELEARGWSQSDLAEILGRPPRLVSELIGGKRALTPETARGLAQAFGTSAELWLNLESSYQLSKVKGGDGDVSRRARLFDKVPVNDLVRRGWIHRSGSIDALEQQVCRFLEIETLDEEPRFLAAARKADASATWSGAQVAWVARVKQLAEGADLPGYTKEKLDGVLKALRGLLSKTESVQRVPEILAGAGIRFVIVESLPGTKIDGACLWLEKKRPVIGLSFRYDRIDWFWFTLLHELGHVKHEDGRTDGARLDVELVGSGARASGEKSKEEQRADKFATRFLLNQGELDSFVAEAADSYSTERIVEHAEQQKVHAGIVVGQLQHRKLVPYSHFRGYLSKVRELLTSLAKTDGWGVLQTGKSGGRG